jgi:hypothetical protein
MKLLGLVGVSCVLAVPVLAAPVLYTFNATSGSVMLNVSGQGSSSSGAAGTFAVTIDDGTHIGASDTFLLENSRLLNTGTLKISLAGLSTATIYPGSARFLDFAPAEVGHVNGNLVPDEVLTDVYLQATIFVTGLTDTPLITAWWVGRPLPFDVSFTTSVFGSQAVAAHLAGTYKYEVGVTEISLTMTLDLVVDVEGTAHVIPDPALGGVIAMGIGAAGAWLRRRRA